MSTIHAWALRRPSIVYNPSLICRASTGGSGGTHRRRPRKTTTSKCNGPAALTRTQNTSGERWLGETSASCAQIKTVRASCAQIKTVHVGFVLCLFLFFCLVAPRCNMNCKI